MFQFSISIVFVCLSCLSTVPVLSSPLKCPFFKFHLHEDVWPAKKPVLRSWMLRHWASHVTFRIESQRSCGCCVSYFAQHPELGLGLCVIHTRTGYLRACQGPFDYRFQDSQLHRCQDSQFQVGQERLSILQDLLHSSIVSEHLCRCTPSRSDVFGVITSSAFWIYLPRLPRIPTSWLTFTLLWTFKSCARCRPVLFTYMLHICI